MTASTHDYELLDFGAGRKLERWGAFVLDRPCPAAEPFMVRRANLWKNADAKFLANADCDSSAVRGRWISSGQSDCDESVWTVKIHTNTMELKYSPFGHIGVFPEQIPLWQRMSALVAHRIASGPVRVLNLFAYTGGSTLACAAAGANVVHIDSAKNLLARAKRNAELSDLTHAPIRWIAEDAVRFVHREIKRNSRYDAIILDPPSYGHGTGRQVWSLDRDLPSLLDSCFALLSENPLFLLLSCHTPGYDIKKLAQLLKRGDQNYTINKIDSFPLVLTVNQASADFSLPAGFAAFALFNLRSPASRLPPFFP